MTKKLFIIGNGFDLHHGIASKYSEFATYLKDEDRTVFDIAEEYVVPEKDLWSCLDLSRFSAAPSARLSHLSFESDWAFPAQC